MIRTLQIGDDWFEERDGGLGRYYFELLRHLPATGTTTRGLVVGSPRVTESTGGAVIAFARPNDSMLPRLWAARQAALAEIESGSIDLVASHFALYALPIVDRLHSKPHVVHFHGPWSGESGAEGAANTNARIKRVVERIVYSRAKRLIVLSHAFKQELIHRYGIAEELIRVVPGGIDVERFNVTLTREEARQRLDWPTDRPIILSVRRHVRRMGLEDLIDATKLLVQQHPDLLVLLGGSGPISGELKTRIAEFGLEKNIQMIGRIDEADLPTAYRAATMSVVPSQSLEGFGLITLESLASGTPVYVTPIGGLPEVLQSFAPECVFPGVSSAEIAVVLSEVLRGARRIPTEGACRAHAIAGFSWPLIAGRIRTVYEEAM